MKNALIISDGKPGHFNQSVAFCSHLEMKYEIIEVAYRNRACKALSYLLDHLGIYSEVLFTSSLKPQTANPNLIVSTGSATYYANKLLARRRGVQNIAILYPKGYRLNFSQVFCPAYDHPPKSSGITELPLNLCAADPGFFGQKAAEFKTKHSFSKPAVGIIVGGPNAVSEIDIGKLEKELHQIFALTEGMERWVTTSRRTPAEVEQLVDTFPFDYKLINSRDAYNPIPAFIQLCDRLFITSDSASMISECASFGAARVEILLNRQLKQPNKFEELIAGLKMRGAVHVFDGQLGAAGTKIDVGPLLEAAMRKLDDA